MHAAPRPASSRVEPWDRLLTRPPHPVAVDYLDTCSAISREFLARGVWGWPGYS